MIRSLSAALLAAAMFVGTAGAAHADGGYYAAVPATPPAKPSMVIRSTIWRLNGGTLFATQSSERPMITCQLVAQHTGKLVAFSAGGTAFDAATLDRCNARAK